MKTEFEFINLLRRKFKVQSPKSKVRVGIGDDCAVIRQDKDFDLVITADLLVEDVDFRLEWTRAEFVGHKALAVSLSDIAAMGARPVWALVSIGVPSEIWKTDFVEKFYEGWFALANKFKVELVGGDVSRTSDKIVIDSIVAGEVKRNGAVLRSGARAGDLIFVSGRLGGSAASLRLLENGLRFDKAKNDATQKFIQHQLRPNPQTKVGRILGENRLATAMIDLSDGLSSDLAHLCAASGVGANLEAGKIPIAKNLRSVLPPTEDALSFALNGGEDFELLFTVNRKNVKKLEKEIGGIFRIGEITENAGKIELSGESGTVLIEPGGFRHF